MSITDFCPRFRQYDRNFRPAMLVRIVRRLAGRPRLRMMLSPMENYGERERRVISRLASHPLYRNATWICA